MNDNSLAAEQLITLKQKLETAINSRTVLEKDFSSQSTLLIQFISKLSLVCKGIDLELDKRLANLKILLAKSAPISEIEKQMPLISHILQQHSLKNEHNIIKMHEQFHNSGKALQKVNGLPDKLRRQLRLFLNENKDSKKAIIEYVDIFSLLLTYYDGALNTQNNPLKGGILNPPPPIARQIENTAESMGVKQSVLDQFSSILNNLVLSDEHNKQLFSIKKKIVSDISNDKLLSNFLKTFEVIIEDFQHEKQTAKTFLSTLSKTLATVKDAVNSTLSTSKGSQSKQNELNIQLQKQVIEMAGTVDKATSLTEIKTDINHKLQIIASTLEKKNTIEQKYQYALEEQLKAMTTKVNLLEEQSHSFEKRLQEQQIKSMQDALTKLANRAAFDEYFAQEMVRFHHKPFDLAIVVLDLDNFKRINDTYGHTAGDKTLQVIASTLRKKITEGYFIARYGGEEFVLIYSNIKKQALINELNALKKHIARLPFKFKNNKVSITISIGATHVITGDNIHVAFERADTALYQAKNQGKNQVIYL